MKLTDFIIPEAVIAELQATDRDGVIRELVQGLVACNAIPSDAMEEIVAAVVAREKIGSTGFGKGVAVPHVKHPKISKMCAALGRSSRGVEFASMDRQPVYSIVLLLSPEKQPDQHIAAMNAVFINLQNDMFRRFLRQSDTREKLLDVLQDAELGR
jgi:mannitol/fructose-specific phosphotransferase system IIA component (Ntr-type)